MRSSIGLSFGVLLAASAAAAQNGADSQSQPVQNINAGFNPTAPVHQPSNFLSDASAPMSPTYPAADDKPAFRGGSVGDDPDKRRDMPDPQRLRERKFRRERALPEPNSGTHTSTPPGEEASPNSPPEENPGAVEGGPQP